jgi:hypothetical protein
MAPALTVTADRHWKIAEDDDEPVYTYCVEYAKTGRARCRK